jgi:hypothetical protein
MKTTLNIDDKVMADLKREAARQGRTMSELVESALRLLLRSLRKRQKVVALPTFHSGGALVDIADRDALRVECGIEIDPDKIAGIRAIITRLRSQQAAPTQVRNGDFLARCRQPAVLMYIAV